jgi:hypothetical protein
MNYITIGGVTCPYVNLVDNLFLYGWNGAIYLGVNACRQYITLGPWDELRELTKSQLARAYMSVKDKLEAIRVQSIWETKEGPCSSPTTNLAG